MFRWMIAQATMAPSLQEEVSSTKSKKEPEIKTVHRNAYFLTTIAKRTRARRSTATRGDPDPMIGYLLRATKDPGDHRTTYP